MNNETRPVIGVTSPFQMVLPDLTLSPGSESNRLCLVVTSNRCLTLLHLLGLLFFFLLRLLLPHVDACSNDVTCSGFFSVATSSPSSLQRQAPHRLREEANRTKAIFILPNVLCGHVPRLISPKTPVGRKEVQRRVRVVLGYRDVCMLRTF